MKRKLKEDSNAGGSGVPASTSQSKGKGKQAKRQKSAASANKSDVGWPEYFNSLFKTFKAINTVLAFVSSKKQLAVTFSAIRTSVEAQLKHPLEISSVAELKALLPDLVKFSYVPKGELQVHGDKEKDFQLPSRGSGASSMKAEGGHVLILELADNLQPKKSKNAGFAYSQPPAVSPAALKKLIDKRNEACKEALDNLVIHAGPEEDPAALLQDAGREYLPVDPAAPAIPSQPEPSRVVPEHKDRPTIASVVEDILEQPWYKEQIVHHQVFEPKPPQEGNVDPPPSSAILQALADSRKITGFYSHQARAIEEIRQGHHVVVSTSTASGKSVVYQVPLLMSLEKDPDAKAIFVYPTKALAQDQKASLEQLIFSCEGLSHLKVDTYDGDTPQDARATVRETASVIFTNFDTIHASILPHEDTWRKFLKNVKLFVVDELHYYTGLFGSHVALILRRFRRVSAAVGNRRVQFISCTATLANSGPHMQKMFGLESNDVIAITEDGAPASQKDFVVWNPPLVDPMQPALGRASSISEASGLMRFLMKKGIRVILFCKIRKVCELAMKTIKADLSNEGRYDILKRVRPYRGGYSREDRRRIEADAFSGQLLGIIATNALELGVDIGVLDAVIMLGFPMTVPSFRQQAGRAGRRSKDSLIVLLTEPFAVDQYYANHPYELFDKRLEELMVDVDSRVVLEAHLQCASYEMPISLNDEKWFGTALTELCNSSLLKDRDGWYHPHSNFLPYPAAHVSIRGAQDEKYLVVEMDEHADSLKSIEEVEVSRAMFEIYEGGVFLHQGITFITKEVSHDTRVAKVIRADVNYHTSPRDYTDVNALRTYRIRRAKGTLAYYGSARDPNYYEVHVHVKVFGFFKIRNKTILDAVEVDTPAWDRDTTGFWIDVTRDILNLLRSLQLNIAEAIHAAEHAFLLQFPLSEDVRTECKAAEKEYKVTESMRKRPARVIFYDSIGKGGGVSARAFDNVQSILEQACDVVANCPCEDGCTKCVQSPACKEANQVSSKLGALIILKSFLGRELNYSHETPQESVYTGPETIVDAPVVLATPGIEIEEP